jgi:3-phenylpropionate/trans-cinnamate dioxygenase ferredoxin subunit
LVASVIFDAFTDVAGLDELPEPGLLGVDGPDGTPICLVRFGGQVAAYADECTHQAFPLSAGDVRADGTLECVWHGARFDCRTGAVVRDPATEPLVAYPVRVEAGRVFVGPREADT